MFVYEVVRALVYGGNPSNLTSRKRGGHQGGNGVQKCHRPEIWGETAEEEEKKKTSRHHHHQRRQNTQDRD